MNLNRGSHQDDLLLLLAALITGTYSLALILVPDRTIAPAQRSVAHKGAAPPAALPQLAALETTPEPSVR